MRFFPILCLLLASQLLAGCESFTLRGPWSDEPRAGVSQPGPDESVPAAGAGQCPELQQVVCAEPEVKVVERIIERTYEKVVEVPVAKDKLVLGQVEIVAIEPAGLTLRSLIDTGAATSSLSVRELKPFERDGKEWVRFKLAEAGNDEPVTVELPIRRHVRVQRPGFGSQRRPVVNMSLTVGDVTHMVEVNLTERSGMDYPLLVGRNFLKDAAVVDVSRREVQGEPRLPVAD